MTARLATVGALLVLGIVAEARPVYMVVADLPYERVWQAALNAVAGYPLEQAADGRIVTGWREREAVPGEPTGARVRDRVRLLVEPAGVRIARVTVEVEAEAWQGGRWAPLADTGPLARAVLGRLRDAT
jgi:hypothetical protein